MSITMSNVNIPKDIFKVMSSFLYGEDYVHLSQVNKFAQKTLKEQKEYRLRKFEAQYSEYFKNVPDCLAPNNPDRFNVPTIDGIITFDKSMPETPCVYKDIIKFYLKQAREKYHDQPERLMKAYKLAEDYINQINQPFLSYPDKIIESIETAYEHL